MKVLSVDKLVRIFITLCVFCVCVSRPEKVTTVGLEASDEKSSDVKEKSGNLTLTQMEQRIMENAKNFKIASEGSHIISGLGTFNEIKTFSIKYKLYNMHTDALGEVITYTNKISETKWIPQKNLVFVVHGWMQNAEQETNKDLERAFDTSINIKDAYIESNRSENIILLNWEDGAGDVNYIVAAKRSYTVGKALGHMIVTLKMRGFISQYSKVKIVGFSLGAHVAGVAGYFLLDRLNAKITEIIGLDPVGAYFEEKTALKLRLDKTDAEFVQIIHCNMGKVYWPLFDPHFGTLIASGHVDFYPNGGTEQPECLQSIKAMANLCSHFRCSELYASTVRGEQFRGCACEKQEDFLKEKCTTCNGPLMGDLCPRNATGKYYMKALPLKVDLHQGQ